MRKILALMLCLLTAFAPLAARAEAVGALAHPWLPADAAFVSAQGTLAGQAHTYAVGDALWTLTLNAAGQPVKLQSAAGAASGEGTPAAALQTRAEAEAALKAFDAGALIVRAEEGNGAARLWFVAQAAAGWAEFTTAGGLCAADITFGQFIANGQLTFAGASQTLSLLRPGAQLDGMEMDEDDGFLLYEGDAYLDGQEYEFELDAHTGRLLEWERD